jgi:hypothetical protein
LSTVPFPPSTSPVTDDGRSTGHQARPFRVWSIQETEQVAFSPILRRLDRNSLVCERLEKLEQGAEGLVRCRLEGSSEFTDKELVPFLRSVLVLPPAEHVFRFVYQELGLVLCGAFRALWDFQGRGSGPSLPFPLRGPESVLDATERPAWADGDEVANLAGIEVRIEHQPFPLGQFHQGSENHASPSSSMTRPGIAVSNGGT